MQHPKSKFSFHDLFRTLEGLANLLEMLTHVFSKIHCLAQPVGLDNF